MSRAAGILAELRADPALALAVIEGIDVAIAWDPQRHYLGDQHGEPTGAEWHRLSARGRQTYLAHVRRRPDGRWDWWHEGKVESWPGQHQDSVASAEEAMRRADAGLDAAGIPRL